MSKAATVETLGSLHSKLADFFKEQLDSGEVDASTLGAIRAFLKDNDITADPADKGSIDELRKKFSKDAQKQEQNVVSLVDKANEEYKEA